MNEDKKVSKWLRITVILLVIVLVFTDYIINKSQTTDDDLGMGQAIGMTIWTLIGAAIALGCARQCSDWAKKINKSMNFAYIMGFVFSLLGLLGYWIYFKIKEENDTPIRNK